jgi:hypothetical protein
VITTLILLANAAAASAQVCDGRLPFNYRAAQAAVGVSNGDAATLSGSAAYGRDLLFARAVVAGGNDGRAFDVIVGSDQPWSPDNRLRACPLVSIGAGWADGDTRLRLGAGGRAAIVAVNTTRLWVVPGMGIELKRDGAQTFLDLDAGIGFVRNPFAVRPSNTKRVGDERHIRGAVVISIGF